MGFKFLKEAENKMAFIKMGVYGPAGSGKTFTSAQVAINTILHYGLVREAAMFDTEPAASFISPYFKKAGIKFYVMDTSRALADLLGFMQEAEKQCSFLMIDSITHIWRDVQESYLKKINQNRRTPVNKLEFHHWGPIKNAFGQFTDRYLSSKIHAIVCGRAGNIYEYQKNNETGKMELITTGSKMASEKEMGYEPSLLVEMSKEVVNDKIINRAFIEKDRANKINGMSFDAPTFEHFRPHFDFINIGGNHFESMNQKDSTELFTADGDDNWGHEKKQREIWCEEIQGLLLKFYPSSSASDKQAKIELIEKYFGTRSWTKVENMRSEMLKEICLAMQVEIPEMLKEV